MKKSIFATILFVAASISLFGQNAPASQGSNLFSGALSITTAGGDLYEYDGDRMFNLNLSGSYASFVTPGLGTGAKLLWSTMSQGDYSYSTLAFGPQMLYFISSDYEPDVIKGKVYPYFGLSFLYQFVSSDYSNENETSGGYIYTVGGGIAIMLTNTVSLNIEADYQGESIESTTGNQINFVIGLSAFL